MTLDKIHVARRQLGVADLTGLFWTRPCERMGRQTSSEMPKKRFSAEQIVVVLRQIEVLMSQDKTVPGGRHFAAELLSMAGGVRRA
jgi:hypothetical protein